jgi:hypothetical protein
MSPNRQPPNPIFHRDPRTEDQLTERASRSSPFSPLDVDEMKPLPLLKQETVAESFVRITSVAHAAPLMPLRERDMQALVELFQQDEIAAIEADILHNLRWRYPEPYWDEFEFELLQDC